MCLLSLRRHALDPILKERTRCYFLSNGFCKHFANAKRFAFYFVTPTRVAVRVFDKLVDIVSDYRVFDFLSVARHLLPKTHVRFSLV